MSSPMVSIVLPVRDSEATIERALASVLTSRLQDFELVCVDDGSKDKTRAILNAYATEETRVQVVEQEPRGIVAALNLGLRVARAPLVARMDADDEMHPERLTEQSARMRAEPQLALVGCQVESFREGGLGTGYRIYTEWVNALVDADQIRRECLVECPIPHPTWMFRRDLILRLGGYRQRPWPEDLDLLYRILAAGFPVAKIPAKLHRWRDHDARASRVDPRYQRQAFARAKAHFARRLIPMQGAVIWGAGKTGRRFARLLEHEGVQTHALLDIHPNRQGTIWRGIPILAPESLPEQFSAWRERDLRVLSAVASRGARGQIRRQMNDWGFREGDDFTMVA